MASPLKHESRFIDAAELDRARRLVEKIYFDEMYYPGSKISRQLVRLNLEHLERVRANACAIAAGEGLNVPLLELAAILHDVAKLDHRDADAGGIDTWHHHHRGASLARKLVFTELPRARPVAESIAQMIDCHSDIPFIRRYWTARYEAPISSPLTPEDFALRDADVIDMLWVAGMSKIVHFRQVRDSEFYHEDGGDIQKAISSARTSFQEAIASITTNTGKRMAQERIATVRAFFNHVTRVESLQEFARVCSEFMRENQPGGHHPGNS